MLLLTLGSQHHRHDPARLRTISICVNPPHRQPALSMNMTTETPLDVIRHVSQGNPSHNGPPPPPTGTPDQAVATGHPAFMRVVVRHLFGCTTLHLLPVPEAMSRGQAMTEVVRLRNEQTSSLVRYVEGIYVKDVIEVVSICNVSLPKSPDDPASISRR